MRNDGVTDVQLCNLRDFGDRLDVVIVQPVTGIDLQAQAGRVDRGCADALQLLTGIGSGFGIGAGVNLDDRRAGGACRLDLDAVCCNEQRDADAGVSQCPACRA